MGIGNPVHLAFIAIVALIVLGPKRLPDLARSLGNGMREFRESLNAAITDDEPELTQTVVAPVHPAPPEVFSGEAAPGVAAPAPVAQPVAEPEAPAAPGAPPV